MLSVRVVTRYVVALWRLLFLFLLSNTLTIPGNALYPQALLSKFETKSVFCEEGKSYTISSGADLRDKYEELECIFDLGVVPSKEPVGMYYGGILSIASTQIVNFVGEQIWQGKMGLRTQCKDKDTEYVFVQNFIFGDLIAPAYVYIGTLKDPIRTTERDNGKDYLFIDYTISWENLCPVSGQDTNSSPATISNIYPISSVVDVARVVGKTNDGGQIILGKTLYRDISDFPSTGDLTIAWWFVINYDRDSYPDVIPSTLGPTEEDFEVTYKGLLDQDGLLQSVLGINGIMNNPSFALQKLIYFLTRRPLGIPIFPNETELYNFLSEWPLAGNPLPGRGFELEQPLPISPPYPKSGRRPSVPNTMGSPLFADLKNLISGKYYKRDSAVFDDTDFETSKVPQSGDENKNIDHGESITGRPGSGITDVISAALSNVLPDAAKLQTSDSFTNVANLEPVQQMGKYVNYLPEKTVASLGSTPVGATLIGLPDQSMDYTVTGIGEAIKLLAAVATNIDASASERSADDSNAFSKELSSLKNVSDTLTNLRNNLLKMADNVREVAPNTINDGFLE